MLKKWLTDALKTADMTQTDLARELERLLQRAYYPQTVSNMVKGLRSISGEEMIAIEKITGVPTPNNQSVFVPLVGKVAAGAIMKIAEDAQGPFEEVTGPPNATERTVAAEIDGDCLGPLLNGWLVFWDRQPAPPTPGMLGRMCVIGLDDGRIMIKQLERGTLPGVFTLRSQFEPPIYDVVVRWASPITAIMPR